MSGKRLALPALLVCFLFFLTPASGEATGTQQNPPPLEVLDVPPEVAATHILKKVEPVYPASAKAAGVQGVVRVELFIGLNGHVNGAGAISGWAILRQAAERAKKTPHPTRPG